MKQALRLCRTGCGRCVSTARSIFVKKKKKQLAHLKEDAVRLRAKRNRLHTELARLSSERNRLSSERNDLRAELANLQQQQKDPTERLRKRFKTVVDHAFAKCLNAAPVLEAAPDKHQMRRKSKHLRSLHITVRSKPEGHLHGVSVHRLDAAVVLDLALCFRGSVF